jgi:hypothetical protein
MPAHRRLGDLKTPRRPRKVQLFRNGNKRMKVPQFHAEIPPMYSSLYTTLV